MFYDSDMDVFVSDFSVAATFGAATIKVVFDNSYRVLVDGVESAAPAATCKSSDVAAAVHGSIITINSSAYKIISIHPDGAGTTLLVLSKD